MTGVRYLLENFFTHKDFLLPADQIPGTLFTPLHFIFAAIVLSLTLMAVHKVARDDRLRRRVFIGIWICAVILEVLIVSWESLSGRVHGMDFQTNLSLYPCSLFLYTLPFSIWGKGTVKKIADGYLCTLGFLGGAVNFLYPALRLSSYSCISFVGFHTFSFHASMVFVCLCLLISREHSFQDIQSPRELFYPCIPTLLLSIPANLVNYTIDADYMLFRGQLPLFQLFLHNFKDVQITAMVYLFYILAPALVYLPGLIKHLDAELETELLS